MSVLPWALVFARYPLAKTCAICVFIWGLVCLHDVSELQCWGGYAVGMASFLQYHHWARRRDGGGVIMLEKVKDSARAWTEDGKLSELRRVSTGMLGGRDMTDVQELDVVEVLYEATGKLSGTRPEELLSFERGLHPTDGSLNRPKR